MPSPKTSRSLERGALGDVCLQGTVALEGLGVKKNGGENRWYVATAWNK